MPEQLQNFSFCKKGNDFGARSFLDSGKNLKYTLIQHFKDGLNSLVCDVTNITLKLCK